VRSIQIPRSVLVAKARKELAALFGRPDPCSVLHLGFGPPEPTAPAAFHNESTGKFRVRGHVRCQILPEYRVLISINESNAAQRYSQPKRALDTFKKCEQPW